VSPLKHHYELGRRPCVLCYEVKPFAEFPLRYKDRARKPQNLQPQCLICTRLRGRRRGLWKWALKQTDRLGVEHASHADFDGGSYFKGMLFTDLPTTLLKQLAARAHKAGLRVTELSSETLLLEAAPATGDIQGERAGQRRGDSWTAEEDRLVYEAPRRHLDELARQLRRPRLSLVLRKWKLKRQRDVA
jgi:hypothetical protein